MLHVFYLLVQIERLKKKVTVSAETIIVFSFLYAIYVISPQVNNIYFLQNIFLLCNRGKLKYQNKQPVSQHKVRSKKGDG